MAVDPWVLVVHAAATFYMVGLVWFVQRVHYPLFAVVGAGRFPAYQRAHLARTAPVVAPVMLAEAAAALWLFAFPPPVVPRALPGLGLALLCGVWLSTFGLQVPRHEELRDAFRPDPHRALVATNWIRTALWSLRGGVALAMLLLAIGGGGGEIEARGGGVSAEPSLRSGLPGARSSVG